MGLFGAMEQFIDWLLFLRIWISITSVNYYLIFIYQIELMRCVILTYGYRLCVLIVFLCLSGAHMVTRGVHLSKCVVYLGIWPLDLVWSIGGLKHLTQNRIRISIHLNIYLQVLDTSKSADWLLSVATVWG